MAKEIEVKEKQKLQQQAQDLLSVASELKVSNQDENEAATEYLKVVKSGKKMAEEYFDARIKPLYQTYKTLNGDKKKVVSKFTDAEREVKKKMAKYLEGEEKKAKKIQEKVEKEAEKRGIEAPKIQQHKTEGQIKRTQWYAVVKDKSKIPLDYLEPDMKKLDRMARGKKGKSDIPGVEFKSKTVIGIR